MITEDESVLELVLDFKKRQIFKDILYISGTCGQQIQSGNDYPSSKSRRTPEYKAWDNLLLDLTTRYNAVLKKARKEFPGIIPQDIRSYGNREPTSFTELRTRVDALHMHLQDYAYYQSYSSIIKDLVDENKILVQELKKWQKPLNEKVYTKLVKIAANQILTEFKNQTLFLTNEAYDVCIHNGKPIGKSTVDKAIKYLAEDRKILRLKEGRYKIIDASRIN